MSTKIENNGKKEKTCFVIMPIADMDGYETGHFTRVYNHLIKPACEKSGFKPSRADEVASSNYIIIDILQKILDSDMVLCDLSGRNPNVLYELGIRQAFNLPTVLIKDIKTVKIFDIQGLRYTEYNQTLRIDEVVRDAELIQNAIKQTEESDNKDVNSLIQLLAVKPATRPSSVELSNDTSVILGALRDLSNRLSSFESNQVMSSPGIEIKNKRNDPRKSASILKINEGTYIINNEKMDIGEKIYIDGRSIGTFADAKPNGVRVKTDAGHIAQINVDDPRFGLLTTVPF